MQPPQPPTGAPVPSPPIPAPPRASAFDPTTRRQTLIVAAVIAALFFGSQILNEAIPASAGQARPGEAVGIAGTATITPLDDWVVSEFDDGSGIRLEKGVVVLDLFEAAAGSAGELAGLYLEEALREQSTELTSTDIETTTITIGSAARFSYQGLFIGAEGAIEGEVTTLATAGQGVVGDAWAPRGGLGGLLDEVHQMLATIEVAG